MLQFYCEATGKLTKYDISLEQAGERRRLFSSALAETRHVEKERKHGMKLAHSKCFVLGFDDDSDSNMSEINRLFVWVHIDPDATPARYRILRNFALYREKISAHSLIPFFPIEQHISTKAVKIATEIDPEKLDPFEYAEMLERLRNAGKYVKGSLVGLGEHDMAYLLGVSQPGIHSKRQLINRSEAVLEAYYNGSLTMTQATKICRLPISEQADFLPLCVGMCDQELNIAVTKKLREIGDTHGRDGYVRSLRSNNMKVRKLRELVLAEKQCRAEYRQNKSVVRRGRLQGLQFALGVLGSLEDPPRFEDE